jgi:hypothetical protein
MAKMGDKTVRGESASSTGDIMFAIGKSLYANWMLALDENFEWEEEIYTKEPVIQESFIKYHVAGIDKINGRECFKVNIEFRNKVEDQEKTQNFIVWVDIKDRILVRHQSYVGNLQISEINLMEVK